VTPPHILAISVLSPFALSQNTEDYVPPNRFTNRTLS
jgi:hypothetical protein